ncbi:MAG: SDR family oxidoreductase [Victivallales bacterium]|jgi:3-oxoacyl-[acyl-carrier protein] reductase|nr:SDR family oxidoreductase [Victivallales bacterium]
MNMELVNRTAIVTGGASGIGLLACQELAKQGANVVLLDFNGQAAEEEAQKINASGGKAIALEVDVRNHKQVQACADRALKEFGSIDILINCAGGNAARVYNYWGPWQDMPYEAIDWGIDVNLKGAVFCARAVLGTMIDQKRGVIVNVGSIDGLTGATVGIEYSASKSGMIAFTKSLALCGAPYSVRSVCVVPGPVLTRPAMAKMKTPLGRAAEPIEIVNLILYLCSDKAAFITGSTHLIDGGRACGGMA